MFNSCVSYLFYEWSPECLTDGAEYHAASLCLRNAKIRSEVL